MMGDFKDSNGVSLRRVVSALQMGTQISVFAPGVYHNGVRWRGHSQKMNHEIPLISAQNSKKGEISSI